MNLERGFRRIVLAVSVGLWLLSLAVIWLEADRRIQAESRAQWVGKSARELLALSAESDEEAERILGRRLTPIEILTRETDSEKASRIRRATWMVGLPISLGVALVPWGLFYVVRWVVLGFRGADDSLK